MATAYWQTWTLKATASWRVTRFALAMSTLVWISLLSVGCGSAEYNAKVEATAAELRRNQPVEPTEEPEEAEVAPAEPDPEYTFEEEGEGAGGTPVGNAIGLAPM